MEDNSVQKKTTKRIRGQWMAIGIAIGAAIGVAMDNIPIGITLGIVLGLAVGNMQVKIETDRHASE